MSMAKMIDITSRLTNERPVLKLGEGKEYPIDNRKNTVLTIQQRMNDGGADTNEIDGLLELALGKDAVKEINESDISFADYQMIFIGVMAGALGEEFETVEARFLEAKQTV